MFLKLTNVDGSPQMVNFLQVQTFFMVHRPTSTVTRIVFQGGSREDNSSWYDVIETLEEVNTLLEKAMSPFIDIAYHLDLISHSQRTLGGSKVIHPTLAEVKSVLTEYHNRPDLLEPFAKWLHENYLNERTDIILLERPIRQVIFGGLSYRLARGVTK